MLSIIAYPQSVEIMSNKEMKDLFEDCLCNYYTVSEDCKVYMTEFCNTIWFTISFSTMLHDWFRICRHGITDSLCKTIQDSIDDDQHEVYFHFDWVESHLRDTIIDTVFQVRDKTQGILPRTLSSESWLLTYVIIFSYILINFIRIIYKYYPKSILLFYHYY